jgi:hypothetical protein
MLKPHSAKNYLKRILNLNVPDKCQKISQQRGDTFLAVAKEKEI